MRTLLLALACACLAVLLVLLVEEARGQDCPQASPLRSGEVATCDGILWPRLYSLQALGCLRVELPKAQTLAELNGELLQNCETTQEKTIALYEETKVKLEDLSREAAGIGPDRPWYRETWVLLTIGAIGGGAVVYIIRN